ncbi:MAG: RidA family protein [Chloroflexi bacterium]|nr:RidA family protein [Chloroflexota bacterium]
MSVADRLKELGITLPEAVTPLAVYRPVTRAGNLLFLAGQVPLKDGAVLHPGRLGEEVTVEQGYAAARQCAINALAAVQAFHGTLEGLRVVKTSGFVASAVGFVQAPQVVNGASELLRDIFGEEDGIGARTAIGVAMLPANSPVEVELVMEVR